MKRMFAGFLWVAALALMLGAAKIGNDYLRPPPVNLLPLPDHLVPLSSPTGQQWLRESDTADYLALSTNFVPQSRRAFCGVATAMTALTAAGTREQWLDERGLFAHPGVKLHPLKVSFTGMSLRELGELLAAHGASVSTVPASSTHLASFRETARANLARPGDYLLINYERAQVGQQKMGHISPVAAYHEGSDRLLILDVAPHKYPPVWVRVDDVWKAMRVPLHPRTQTTRGFLLVHAASR